MDTLDLLLLHGAWRYHVPMEFVIDTELSQICWFNYIVTKPDEGPKAIERMLELERLGLIQFGFFHDEEVRYSDDRVISRSEAQPFLELPKFGRLDYKLTAAGGAVWQEEAKVRWDKLVFRHRIDTAEGRCLRTFRSTNPQLLSQWSERIVKFGGNPSEVEAIGHWEATYWKTFSTCYEFKWDCPENVSFRESSLILPWYSIPTLRGIEG